MLTGQDKQALTTMVMSTALLKGRKDKAKLVRKDFPLPENLLLPDGKRLVCNEELNLCFDLYFGPIASKRPTLQEMVYATVSSLAAPVRSLATTRVFTIGGPALAKSFIPRLQEEYDSFLLISSSLRKLGSSLRVQPRLYSID